MKNLKNLKIFTFLAIGAFCIVSCEKSELEIEENLVLEQEADQVLTTEGFKSTSGRSGETLENVESSKNRPLLHMHFDEDISMKDATLQWDKAVKEFISKQPKQQKGFSTEWFYRVWTKTGTQSNNDTDGDVGTYARFTTSVGRFNPPFNWMDNFGDDREGGWDAYLFKTSFPGRAVEWVEVDGATLYLKGQDGWFVTDFVIQLWAADQTVTATGFSGFWATPNVWLDNPTDTGWDSFNSGNTGTGRINF